MKIATWNVNSLRVRLPQVLRWLEEVRPDVLALQEIKQTDEAIGTVVEEIAAAGYDIVANGQKTYNGVALLSRSPITDAVRDLSDFDDPARRFLSATVNDVRIVNVYIPNGQSLESDKYSYKLEWLRALHSNLRTELAAHERLIVLGDFNIAPADADVWDPARWANSVLVSEPEREAFVGLLSLGLVDLFRKFDQPEKTFSWWDYRARGFERNAGLRIDLILGTANVADACRAVQVDNNPRSWERPSDHAPVIAQIDDCLTESG